MARDQLQLTRGTNYSFHALVLLAGARPEEVMSIGQLAKGVKASPTYMGKLLHRLSQSGLVKAQRGRGGGYCLARPASDITLWEVVSTLHGGSPLGSMALPICSKCSIAAACPLKDALRSAEDDIRRRLETVTVGSLVKLLEDVAHSTPSPA